MRLILITFIIVLCTLPNGAFANEGAGLLYSDLDGALPKSLWRDQPRSEIAELLKKLPADAPLRSLQQIKRNMLLSQYDVTSIDNDIKPSPENNLLNLRLQKLIEMGKWKDAFRLYSTKVDDPQDNDPLAQTGILLVLFENGLATACLEEKVFKSRFESTPFWRQIDNICNIELGSMLPSTADFAGSDALKSLYNDNSFTISANNINKLAALSPLELTLLSQNGRINYENTSPSRETPPFIIKTFLNDSKFPKSQQSSLKEIAIQQGILPLPHPANGDENTAYLSQVNLTRIIAQKLELNQKISEDFLKKLHQLAPTNPENYFYLKYLGMMNPQKTLANINDEDILSSIEALSIKTGKKVNFLKSLLDKSLEFSNNPANVYEKRTDIASDDTIIVKGSSVDQLKKAIKSKYAGLSLLIMLSNIENSAWVKSSVDISEEQTFNMLKSLSEVGLIDQSHQVANEELAILMRLKN